METTTAIGLMQQAMFVSLLVPAPVLAGVLVVGLVVSIFQAATQIHEMTLVFIPKMAITYFLIFILGHWMLFTIVHFGNRIFSSIPQMIR